MICQRSEERQRNLRVYSNSQWKSKTNKRKSQIQIKVLYTSLIRQCRFWPVPNYVLRKSCQSLLRKWTSTVRTPLVCWLCSQWRMNMHEKCYASIYRHNLLGSSDVAAWFVSRFCNLVALYIFKEPQNPDDALHFTRMSVIWLIFGYVIFVYCF